MSITSDIIQEKNAEIAELKARCDALSAIIGRAHDDPRVSALIEIASEVDEEKPLAAFEVRCEHLLDRVYRGLHHIGGPIHKHARYWEINERSDLSTYDADLMTRYVIAAHDECIRVEVTGCGGPGRVKILLHPRRARQGSMFDRHPTIGQAILNYRKYARLNVYHGEKRQIDEAKKGLDHGDQQAASEETRASAQAREAGSSSAESKA